MYTATEEILENGKEQGTSQHSGVLRFQLRWNS
jgi:hypothetical protein